MIKNYQCRPTGSGTFNHDVFAIDGITLERLKSIGQFWILFGVCLEMFALSLTSQSIEGSETIRTARTEQEMHQYCIPNGGSGLSAASQGLDLISSWASSSLGKPLLSRLVKQLFPETVLMTSARCGSLSYLREIDVQTLATAICIAGGSQQMYELLTEEVCQPSMKCG
jgi:hypothetical protein